MTSKPKKNIMSKKNFIQQKQSIPPKNCPLQKQSKKSLPRKNMGAFVHRDHNKSNRRGPSKGVGTCSGKNLLKQSTFADVNDQRIQKSKRILKTLNRHNSSYHYDMLDLHPLYDLWMKQKNKAWVRAILSSVWRRNQDKAPRDLLEDSFTLPESDCELLGDELLGEQHKSLRKNENLSHRTEERAEIEWRNLRRPYVCYVFDTIRWILLSLTALIRWILLSLTACQVQEMPMQYMVVAVFELGFLFAFHVALRSQTVTAQSLTSLTCLPTTIEECVKAAFAELWKETILDEQNNAANVDKRNNAANVDKRNNAALDSQMAFGSSSSPNQVKSSPSGSGQYKAWFHLPVTLNPRFTRQLLGHKSKENFEKRSTLGQSAPEKSTTLEHALGRLPIDDRYDNGWNPELGKEMKEFKTEERQVEQKIGEAERIVVGDPRVKMKAAFAQLLLDNILDSGESVNHDINGESQMDPDPNDPNSSPSQVNSSRSGSGEAREERHHVLEQLGDAHIEDNEGRSTTLQDALGRLSIEETSPKREQVSVQGKDPAGPPQEISPSDRAGGDQENKTNKDGDNRRNDNIDELLKKEEDIVDTGGNCSLPVKKEIIVRALEQALIEGIRAARLASREQPCRQLSKVEIIDLQKLEVRGSESEASEAEVSESEGSKSEASEQDSDEFSASSSDTPVQNITNKQSSIEAVQDLPTVSAGELERNEGAPSARQKGGPNHNDISSNSREHFQRRSRISTRTSRVSKSTQAHDQPITEEPDSEEADSEEKQNFEHITYHVMFDKLTLEADSDDKVQVKNESGNNGQRTNESSREVAVLSSESGGGGVQEEEQKHQQVNRQRQPLSDASLTGEEAQLHTLSMKQHFALMVAARLVPVVSVFSDAGDLEEQDKLRNTLLTMKIDAKAISEIQQSIVSTPSQVKPTNDRKTYKAVVSEKSVHSSHACASDNVGSNRPSSNMPSSNLPKSYGTGLTSGVTGHEGGEDDLCMWMRYELLINKVDAALGNYPHLRTKVFYCT